MTKLKEFILAACKKYGYPPLYVASGSKRKKRGVVA